MMRRVPRAVPVAGAVVVAALLLFSLPAPVDISTRQSVRSALWPAQPADGEFGMYDDRAFPFGRIPVGAHAAALEEARSMSATSATGLRWRELGPRPIFRTNFAPYYQGRGPITGRVTALANHPTNKDIAYLGSAGGGVWKTTDGGRRWRPMTDDQPQLNIGALAIDPDNPNTIYAGTGEANVYYYALPGNGVMKSTDGGASWEHLGLDTFANCYFSDLVITPGEPETIVASVTAGNLSPGASAPTTCQSNGLLRSEDGGETWTPALRGYMWDLATDPENPATLYAAASGVTTLMGGAPGGSGIFKSIDGGLTWIKLAVGPPEGYARAAVAVSRSDPQRVYAAFVNAVTYTMMGIFMSPDGGVTWVPAPYDRQPCSYDGSAFEEQSQCFYDFALAVDPGDPDLFFIGGVNLTRHRALDPATRMIGEGAGGIHVDQHALSFDAAGRFWVGNDGGVYRSSDQGDTWKNLNWSLNLTQFYPGIAGRLGTRILGGSQDNGTSMYKGSKRWVGVLGADGGYAAVDHRNPKRMYGTYQNLYILKTKNGGWTWRRAMKGISGSESRAFIAPMVMSPHDPRVLYAGTTRVYKTRDRAAKWKPSSPPLGGTVRAIGVVPSARGHVYAGTSTGLVWLKKGAKKDWVPTGTGLPTRVIGGFAFSKSPKVAYVSMLGYNSGHVYKTTDFGKTWRDISGNIPNAPVNEITYDSKTGTLFAASDVGLFSTSNEGKTWQLQSGGLPTTMVTDVMVDQRARKLIAATHGRGMWVAKL